MTRFGFFGPSNDHDVPPGGFCISVFALIRKGEAVLVLKPKKDPRWEQEWSPNWRIYEPEHLEREMASWRLPSSYVKEGESPATALDRVMRDQMGIKNYAVSSSSLENFYEESRRYQGRMHWDYCFVFCVSVSEEARVQPWIEAIEYLNPTEIKGRLGSAQDALLSRVGLS